MTHPLDHIATTIFRAALNQDPTGELLECLLNEGSATVDSSTGKLVLLRGDQLGGLGEPA